MQNAGKAIKRKSSSRPASVPPAASPRHPAGRIRRHAAAALALAALTGLAFSDCFSTGLALDSRALVLQDSRIQNVTADNLSLILHHTYWWPNGESGLYRPWTTLSLLFNYAILGNGGSPAGYHWVNFGLHVLNVLLLFALLRILLAEDPRGGRLALVISGLWAVHPALTESVTNIAGRADLLAGAAVLGGFLFYLEGAAASGWKRLGWFLALSAATAMGAFSKESAVVLPAIVILYELFRRKSGQGFAWKNALCGSAAMGVPIGLMLWQRAIVLSSTLPPEFPFVDNPIAGAGFWTARLTALKVLGRYLKIGFFPLHLSADYSYAQIPLASGSAGDWAAWLAVAAVAAGVLLLYRRNRVACFFACFAFLNLLPGSNLLFPIGTIMAERLLYLPLIGLLAASVLVADAAALRLRIPAAGVAAMVCLALAGLSVRTWLRNRDWRDDLTMAEAAVRSSPDSFKVHRLLAVELDKSDPKHRNFDRVLREADRSVAILAALPDRFNAPDAWNLAAAFHLAEGDRLADRAAWEQYQKSARLARRAIAIDSARLDAYHERYGLRTPAPAGAAYPYRILASAYLRLEQPAEALDAALQARKIDPADAQTYGQIADAYVAEERGEDAAIALAEGMFATGDRTLRQDLLELYGSGVDTRGCAVVEGPRGPALNPGCAMVHRDLCQAASRAGRQEFWNQLQCRQEP